MFVIRIIIYIFKNVYGRDRVYRSLSTPVLEGRPFDRRHHVYSLVRITGHRERVKILPTPMVVYSWIIRFAGNTGFQVYLPFGFYVIIIIIVVIAGTIRVT